MKTKNLLREDGQTMKNGVVGEWRVGMLLLYIRREDEESPGGVDTWARTNSPATPPLPSNNYPN